jgi:hypothetical protein
MKDMNRQEQAGIDRKISGTDRIRTGTDRNRQEL